MDYTAILKPFISPDWITAWLIWGFLVACILAWLPVVGSFITFLGLAFVIGFMPHMIAAAFCIDVLVKGAPKALLIIPLLPYALYYTFFFFEWQKIKAIEKQIRYTNPEIIVEYDPEKHALPSTIDVKSYKIPVTFRPDHKNPDNYVSARILTKKLCGQVKNIKGSRYIDTIEWYDGSGNRFENLCTFIMPEKPSGVFITYKTRLLDEAKKSGLKRTRYTFYKDEQKIGEYTDAVYKGLPVFPFLYIGCYNFQAGSLNRGCEIEILKEAKNLKLYPASNKIEKFPLGQLLGIEKYTEAELRNFQDNPEIIKKLTSLANQEK